MATPNQESIATFMSITGSSGLVAIQKLTEHGGNLNEAVNAHFTEGDTNIRHQPDVAALQDDFMDIDEPSETITHRPPISHFPESAPRIENVTETLPETHGTLTIDDDDDFQSLGSSHTSHDTHLIPSAPAISDLPDYGIEEEMIRAAIEASKHDAEISQPDDPEITHAVSSSLKSTEQEKNLHEPESEAGPSETKASNHETENTDEQPLVRRRNRHMGTGPINNHVDNENDFPSDNWGGMSSEEHDEAVMLEAAMFGGIPDGIGHRVRYARHRNMQNGFSRGAGGYPRPQPRPPSPSLTAQRLIREQQDDEYLASLQADREKELLEEAAREAAMEEERRKEEQEQETERQLAAKEASLPEEPKSDDENAVTLVVRMPDGSRRGRRFMRTDKLKYLFDFMDVGRVVKPTTYRLVRPYPRRAFSDGESELTLNELGLTSKQEALFLELI